MKRKIAFALVLSALFVLVSCKGETGPAGASGTPGETLATVVFQYGVYPSQAFEGTKDTRILSNPATTNYGAEAILGAGHVSTPSNIINRSLIHYDIASQIPAGSISVKKAYLTIFIGEAYGATTVTAYAVTGSNRNWGEEQATWQTYNGTNSWGSFGGDFSSVAATDSKVITVADLNAFVTFEITPSVVQSWFDNPVQNFGLVIKGTNETAGTLNAIGFASKESSQASYRPKLTIYYTVE